jgi:hypothetical protein
MGKKKLCYYTARLESFSLIVSQCIPKLSYISDNDMLLQDYL